tara:strand:- start:636 stop:872 length:237 start_codon:yes stop_codon:yes gene_type:complete
MKIVVLSMIICSALHGNCQIPYEKSEHYTNWADCMRQGYIDSLQVLNLMGDQYINENKVFIKFACAERIKEDQPGEDL